jgi:hypothetical protein
MHFVNVQMKKPTIWVFLEKLRRRKKDPSVQVNRNSVISSKKVNTSSIKEYYTFIIKTMQTLPKISKEPWLLLNKI